MDVLKNVCFLAVAMIIEKKIACKVQIIEYNS